MAITKEMQAQLAKLARRANRRLERATEGQRASLEHYISKYHTRETEKGSRFQQGKAKTEAEYRQRTAELLAFLQGETTTRKGWERVKKEGVQKAGQTLGKMGYELTDSELAVILEELPQGADSAAFYRALENVEAAKASKGQQLDRKSIAQAILSKATDYEATLAAIKKRR